jgi:DNA-directed RNA polymerase subunit RPC12/RpoP
MESGNRSEQGVGPVRHIIAYPANMPCPVCGATVQDWHLEWTDPVFGLDFYKGLRAIDCPLCNGWVLYKDRTIQAVPAGDSPRKTKRNPLQAARWAKSQSQQGSLRGYLNQSPAGDQYRDYFTDLEVQDADADAQADPRY